jgi:hypothetical protein
MRDAANAPPPAYEVLQGPGVPRRSHRTYDETQRGKNISDKQIDYAKSEVSLDHYPICG